jgi:hypothetical protein
MSLDETKLNAYLDGELPTQEREWVEQHLASSPQAQALLARLRQEARQTDQGLDILSPPAELHSAPVTALKQLQARLNLDHQASSALRGTPSENKLPLAWESPTLLSEITNVLRSFQIRRRQTMKLLTFKHRLALMTGLSLVVMAMAAFLILQPNIGKLITRLAQSASRPETTTATPSGVVVGNDGQVPEDITPVSAIFDGKIELIGYKLLNETITPGNPVRLTLYWRGLQPIEEDYTAFVQLFDPEGEILMGFDGPPGQAPTSEWQPYTVIDDHHDLVMVEGLPSGNYSIRTGLYKSTTHERLSIRVSEMPVGDSIQLAQIEVNDGAVGMPAEAQQMITTTIVFDDAVEIAGYQLFTNTISAGDAVRLKLYWRRRPAASAAYNSFTSFIQLVDSQGTVLAEKLTPLPMPQANLGAWLSGQTVEIPYILPLYEKFPTGEFDLLAGVSTVAQNLHLPIYPDIHQAQNITFLSRIKVTDQISPASSAPRKAANSHFAYGIQADPKGDTAANIEHLVTLRFDWVKLEMSWKEIEPRRGEYDWAQWDEVIGAYADRVSDVDINILLTISEAPDWVRPADDDKTVAGFPADPAQYAGFVAQVAGRYKGQVQAIEIWQEQNVFYEVGGQGRVDPAAYTELLKQAYIAIKAVNPEMIVVSGGLVPTSAPPPFAMDDVDYLRQMYASGAQDYFDALGAHLPGFANPPDALYEGGDYDPTRGYDDQRSFFFRNTAEAYRQVLIENDDEAKAVWPTQFGWPVLRNAEADPPFTFAEENSARDQMEYTVRAYQMGQAWGWVGPMFLSNLDYNITAPDTQLAHFGILDTPTYAMLANRSAGLRQTGQTTQPSRDQQSPSAPPAPTGITEENTGIVVVLDISGSMAAEDFEPNRLGAAKTVIQEFIAGRQGRRVGLVTFASQVVGQIQPTLDHTMLNGAVQAIQLSWNIGVDSGTAIGLGLDEAIRMLQDSTAQNKIIILLTDGANNSGNIEPLAAAQTAKVQGIRVYTIGAAKQGPARLPFPDGRVEYRDSEIDEEMLKEIANLTGGLYFRAEDTAGLQEIYKRIGELEDSQ